MVSKRFLTFILVIATTLKLSNGSGCHDTSRDLNTKWREADVLEQLGHDVYQSLALGPFDAKDPEKRFFSVYGQALFQYLISKVPGEVERVREAVHKANKQLQKPSEVLAGPLRATISLLFSFVELPLTDVQQACPYKIREADCQKALSKIQAERIKSCPGYKHNIAMYNSAVEFVTSSGFQNILKDILVAVNKATDKNALNFFSNSALVKHSNAVQMFKNVFNAMNGIPTSEICTMFSFL